MGRKIPGKKHRTIKDPYKQKQQRLERFKIDNPPSSANQQEIPKSLLRIKELIEKTKQRMSKRPLKAKKGALGKGKKSLGKPKRPLKKSKEPFLLSLDKFLDKEQIPKGATKPDRFIPNVVQRPNESDRNFLGRVSMMTDNLIKEVEFEKQYGIEIRKDERTGKVIELKNIKEKNSKSKKKKLSEKRREKLNQKKENLQNVKDFNQFKDKIQFGEVVHRPPDLTALKKPKNLSQKPNYSNLLLQNVVKDPHSNTHIQANNLQKEKAEVERKFIVEAYRRAKKNRKI